jgi:hypothetical protein
MQDIQDVGFGGCKGFQVISGSLMVEFLTFGIGNFTMKHLQKLDLKWDLPCLVMVIGGACLLISTRYIGPPIRLHYRAKSSNEYFLT